MNASSPAKSYGLQWAAFFLVLAGLVWFFYFRPEVVAPVSQNSFLNKQSAVAHSTKDWFLILKIPEVTEGVADTVAQDRFEKWISSLLLQGYHPILLSDAMQRLQKGAAFPARAVVLCFDPGYRQTYETFGPVLVRHGVPAVWITQKDFLERADLHYLSWHQLRIMGKSGLWDIGLKNSAGKFRLTKNPSFFERFRMTQSDRYAFDASPMALNKEIENAALHRLNVNFNWSTDDLMSRLEAELPVEGSSYLAARMIQNRMWGIVQPAFGPEENNPTFDLATDPMKRSNYVAWLGTAGTRNFKLSAEIERIDGEAWLLLRSDDATGKSVNVGFTRDALVVEDYRSQSDKRLLTLAPWKDKSIPPLKADISLIDNKLSIAVNGVPYAENVVSAPGTSKSVVEFLIYDKVRGVAQAKSVNIMIHPLDADRAEAEPAAAH